MEMLPFKCETFKKNNAKTLIIDGYGVTSVEEANETPLKK